MRWFLPVLFVLVALVLPTGAVVIDLGDGSGGTTAPPDDPGWDYVGTQGGLTVIYLGNDWILTAGHVAFNDVTLEGVVYTSVPGSRVQIDDGGIPADLAVWQIENGPAMPLLPIRDTPPNLSDEVVMIGNGRTRGTGQILCNSMFPGFDVSGPNVMRWGTNQVEAAGFDVPLGAFTTRSFYNQLDEAPTSGPDTRCAAGVDCPEAIATVGDSGGAVFLHDGTRWEVAGVMFAVGPLSCDDPMHPERVLFAEQTFMADVSHYRTQILSNVRPECSDEIDNDGDLLVDLADPGCLSDMDDDEEPDCDGQDDDLDTVGNVCDNCLLVANLDQVDTDGDLYGNACDADYTQDGIVGGSDFLIFRAAYLAGSPGNPGYIEGADHTGDGLIGGADFIYFRSGFNAHSPGPSGLVP